jgi:hypothetical protein
VAAAADTALLVVFVLIGRRTHHEDAGTAGFFRVLWPFAVGLAAGWAVTRLGRAPLDLRRATVAALVTVSVGILVRIVVQGHGWKTAFAIIAVAFVAAGMLGWRTVTARVARGARRTAG